MSNNQDVELIDHTRIFGRIESMVDNAEKFIVFVSPYVTIDKLRTLTRLMRSALKKGVKVRLVFREKDASTNGNDVMASTELRSLKADGLELYMVKDLHAKIYMTDKGVLLTSMNLLESSFNNSIEIGTWFDKGHSVFGETVKYLQKHVRENWSEVKDLPEPVVEKKRRKQTAEDSTDLASLFDSDDEAPAAGRKKVAAKTQGHCIRCNTGISLDPEKPLCKDCYSVWKRHEDPNYAEKFCHRCGDGTSTSLAKHCAAAAGAKCVLDERTRPRLNRTKHFATRSYDRTGTGEGVARLTAYTHLVLQNLRIDESR